MKNNLLNALFVSALALSSVAVAQPKKGSAAATPKYNLPAYGMAGCGLGSMAFPGQKNNTALFQILAGTTNNLVFPQTSAITSGTSNCSDSPASEEALRMERETYVAVNLNDLNKEVSKGDGEHLQSLAEILGCGDEQNFSTFAQVAQASHAEIFSDSEPAVVTERILTKVQSNANLRSCLRAK